MSRNLYSTTWVLVNILVLLLFFSTYYFMITSIEGVDIKDHNFLLSKYLKSGFFPLPPGYYLIVVLIDAVIRIKYQFVAASVIVLTVCSWWKFQILHSWIKTELNHKSVFLLFLCFFILFMSPIFFHKIDGPYWYLGKFTPTIWHNSTLITVFPFCLLMTKYSILWALNKSNKDLLKVLGFGICILLIKPSFLFCFIPSFPLYLFLKEKKINSSVLVSAFLSFTLFVLVLLEKELIFNWDPMISTLYSAEERSQVVIAPMKVWLFFSHEPYYDFFTSFPLLFFVIISWKKEVFKNHFFNFSLILLFFSLLVYAIFSETGFREFHGNFYWQIPVAVCLNNLSLIVFVLKDFREKKEKPKIIYILFFIIMTSQILLGVAYWLRIFITGTLS